MTTISYHRWLAHYRRWLGGVAEPPLWLADQLHAARSELAPHVDVYASALRQVRPTAQEHGGNIDEPDHRERVARILAAVSAHCTPCRHLQAHLLQPAIANLALHRLDCGKCRRTLRLPPPGEHDRCDVCGDTGHQRFKPFVISYLNTMAIGDVGPCCWPHLCPEEAA